MSKQNKETPLMKQYRDIKAKYPETILLYRLGDFFETFDDDAIITAKVCGITLTKRNNGAAGKMPLAGFPHHQIDAYLPKLVRAGYRVAVCEQLEDPKQAKGIVKRGVTEVVTPGVALYDKLLESKANNYVAAVTFRTEKSGFRTAGIAALDISTGEFLATEVSTKQLLEVLETLSPSELIINKKQKIEAEDELEKLSFEPAITKLEDWIFEYDFAQDLILRQFATHNLKGFGIDKFSIGIISAGVVLHYINETQKGNLEHIKNINVFNPTEYMILDHATRRNLEITYSMGDAGTEGSLINILDKTNTPMGGRLFKKWITRPLKNLDAIQDRLSATESLFLNFEIREKLRDDLNQIGDLERLISKISTGRANPRDCIHLKNSLKVIPDITDSCNNVNNESLQRISSGLESLSELVDFVESALIDEPSTVIGSGNIFQSGFSEELDSYIEAKYSGKSWISDYQDNERKKTGINSLKIGFNNVFGYYIDVTKVHTEKVPESYQRKQTLTNSERYMTPELKEIESKILTAEEKIGELEAELFAKVKAKIAAFTIQIQKNAALIAQIDCLQSFAQSSQEYNYAKPEINESGDLIIENGRHPVVEKLLPLGKSFTPNSTKLDTEQNQIHIITGPNMSGKSCYLRQVALIVLLGQVGCYVPADSATIGIVDRIFTRVGAQDNISAGESTFLVEMQEAANIMNNATFQSLILLDEVGRGTATFDGISIAWSIAEYIHDNIGAKTLFATHYHELNELAERYEKINNYKVEVVEAGHTIIFSHKVVEGTSDYSFGIHVAKMAGLPYDVVDRADEIMKTLEESSHDHDETSKKRKPDMGKVKSKRRDMAEGQLAIFEFKDDALREKLREIKIDSITPVQALQLLSDLHQKAKEDK